MDILKNTAGNILSYNGTPLGTTWSAVAPPASYPTDGLIARYDFNDNLDDSYLGLHSSAWTTNSGSPLWTYDANAVEGKAFKTNFTWSVGQGTSEMLDCLTDASITTLMDGTNAFSISYWSLDSNPEIQGNQTPFWSTGGNIWSLKLNAGILHTVGVANGVTSTIRIDTGTWNHIVYSYNGGNAESIYINNVLDATSTTRGSKGGTGAFYLCGQVNHQALKEGSMDLLYFYNRALDSADVALLYNGGAGV